ncbi:MAG: hypothetical protein ABI860_10715 [Gemmatimonadales bacterium]
MHQAGKIWPWWQPWLALGLFAFLLHFVWEMLQVPLYARLGAARHWQAVLLCARATGGDVAMALASYGAAALWTHDRLWLSRSAGGSGRPICLATGLLTTVVLERLNVYVWQTWTYTPAMPTLFGIGLAPVLQWLVVPLLTLWLARRHLGTLLPPGR